MRIIESSHCDDRFVIESYLKDRSCQLNSNYQKILGNKSPRIRRGAAGLAAVEKMAHLALKSSRDAYSILNNGDEENE